MSGFAPAPGSGRAGARYPSAHQIRPLPESWDIATELKTLHRYVIDLAACVSDLQTQLNALQAPERPAKRPAADPK